MPDNPIALHIKRFRDTHHWSQEELATVSGVNVRTIQRAEAGHPLSIESLRALAAAFDTTIEVLSLDENEFVRALEDFKSRYEIIELEHIAPGFGLGKLLADYHAYYLHKPLPLSDAQADLLAEFEQNIKDYGDLRAELEPIQRRAAENELEALLASLSEADISISMGSRVEMMRPGQGGAPIEFWLLYVSAVPGQTPLRFLAREKGVQIKLG